MSIWVYPVLLGSGKRLFRDEIAPAAMRLFETRSFDNGVVVLRYERVGKPSYGNMAGD